MTRTITILLASALAAASLSACTRGDDATHAAPAAHDVQDEHDTQDAHDTHDAHGSQDVAVAPPEGGLWPTDEALRAGMSRIEAAVERASAVSPPLSAEHAGELSRAVEENVAFIFKNCKLPPEPDAALHVLIGRMMAAAGQLKDESTSGTGVTQLAGVLHDYRATFDHTATALAP